jgi:multiple sugar transport system permease protein
MTQAPGALQGPVLPVPPAVPRRQRWWWPEENPVKRLIFFAILCGLSVLFMYPFVWTVSASLKPREFVFEPKLFSYFHFHNYVDVWNAAPIGRWFLNSVYIGVLAAIAVTFSSALVAFAFAYFRFPLRNFFFGCVLATMMLPGAVTMVPVYLIWRDLGLANSQYPLWVGNLFGSAFYIFLQRQFFLGIPRELFEAARMDGDNYLTMFWRIALPLAKPALIVTFIFELQASWNDLIRPLIYLRDDNAFTIPAGLYSLLGQYAPSAGGQGDFQWVIAAMVMSTLPMIVIFFLGQRYFIEGIATQGRKG